MTCTFFGHRYVQKEIEPMLRSTLVDLIENHDCRLFYVGNLGGFDAMVTRVLRELSDRYPIRAYTVLAYLPVGENGASDELLPTIRPVGEKMAKSRVLTEDARTRRGAQVRDVTFAERVPRGAQCK